MKRNRPSPRTLATLLEALEEIDGAFHEEGFSTSYSDDQASPHGSLQPSTGRSSEAKGAILKADEDEEAELEEADESEFDADDEGEYYDREDIEVAVDSFLTQIAKRGIIKRDEKRRLPSFSEVFQSLFGERHPLSKLAELFETAIEGYFDLIDPENMTQAHHVFGEIVSGLKEERRVQ